MGGFVRAALVACVTIIVGIPTWSAQSFGADAVAAESSAAPELGMLPKTPEPARPSSPAPAPASPSAAAPAPVPTPQPSAGSAQPSQVASPKNANVPVLSAPPAEQDLVLSPSDVDSRVTATKEPEPDEVAPINAFFADAPEEIGKGENGLYAGLTDRIDKNVRYFQGRGRDRFEVWLARSGKYSGMMRGILEQYGLPGDLI